MSIKIDQTVYVPIPTGKYPAKIAKIEAEEGKFGPQLKFTFEIPDKESEENKSLLGWASQKFNVKSKLCEWTRAALGPIDPDYTFDSDDLLGKRVFLVVTEDTGERGPFNRITQLLPYSAKPKAAPQQKLAPVPAETEELPDEDYPAEEEY